MQKIQLLFLFIPFLYSCGEEESRPDPLTQPPYNKITDSIKRDPKNSDLYYRRGQMLYDRNQPVFAAKDLRMAWDLRPSEMYALSMVTLLKEKHLDSSTAFIEAALQKLPGSVSLQVELAKAYHDKGSIDKALSISDNILNRHPGQLDALLLKSALLKEGGKHEEALQILERAYSLSPGDVEIVHTLGFDYAENKNRKVFRLADSLIAADVEQNHAEPYYFKGIYHYNTGNYKEALRFFDEAIAHDYHFIDAHMSKGMVYYDQKQFKNALETFRLATKVSTKYAPAYYWLGKTEIAMGNKEAGNMNIQLASQLDKEYTLSMEATAK